ncbi:DUF6452 family protein [Flavobacterium sp.]|uniref:DUF6452 family protein n=1 Tax=Flavobacterium sp. TaxID=239 RepID=UPI003C32C529
MKKTILLLLILCLSLSSCEKDDICDENTSTTPRLIITFYDFNDGSSLKNVTNLKIIGDGMTEGVTYNGSSLFNGNQVAIPLKTDAEMVKFKFILNYDDSKTTFIDVDELQFDYTRSTIFVSRACGYKTNYVLNQANPYTHTGKWMLNISVKNRTITNENETHIEVYH